VRGLGAIYLAKRSGLLATWQPATFSRFWRLAKPGALGVGRTPCAWKRLLLSSSTL